MKVRNVNTKRNDDMKRKVTQVMSCSGGHDGLMKLRKALDFTEECSPEAWCIWADFKDVNIRALRVAAVDAVLHFSQEHPEIWVKIETFPLEADAIAIVQVIANGRVSDIYSTPVDAAGIEARLRAFSLTRKAAA